MEEWPLHYVIHLFAPQLLPEPNFVVVCDRHNILLQVKISCRRYRGCAGDSVQENCKTFLLNLNAPLARACG